MLGDYSLLMSDGASKALVRDSHKNEAAGAADAARGLNHEGAGRLVDL